MLGHYADLIRPGYLAHVKGEYWAPITKVEGETLELSIDKRLVKIPITNVRAIECPNPDGGPNSRIWTNFGTGQVPSISTEYRNITGCWVLAFGSAHFFKVLLGLGYKNWVLVQLPDGEKCFEAAEHFHTILRETSKC